MDQHLILRLLLSHHPPEHHERTITVFMGGREWRICARCAGISIGILSGILLALVGLHAGPFSGGRLLLLPVAMMPAMVDFALQLDARYKSNNPRRVFSGGLCGVVLAFVARDIWVGQWAALATCMLTIFAYILWLCAGNRRRAGNLIRHLTRYSDYFELCYAANVRYRINQAMMRRGE